MESIVFYYRLANTFLVGGSLAFCGALIQTITKNPIADSYLTGIAPAAILGFVIGSLIGEYATLPLPYLFSIVASILFSLLILQSKNTSGLVLVTLGIVLGGICLSISNLLIYFNPNPEAYNLINTNLQSKLDSSFPEVAIIISLVVLTAALALDTVLKGLMAGLSIHHSRSANLGVNLIGSQALLTLFLSIIVSVLTVKYGVMPFIGFIVPNLLRVFRPNNPQWTFSQSFFLGGALMIGIDFLGRLVIPPYGVPVSLITPLIGVPFLVYTVLFKKT